MKIHQQLITLPAFSKGFWLITDKIEEKLEIGNIDAGICHLFLMHTSASLCINENADSSVRRDFLTFTETLVPEDFPFTHRLEGDDDMPAHIKSALYGQSLTIPIQKGALVLGVWQGIYLCEHKNYGSSRKIFATIIGE